MSTYNEKTDSIGIDFIIDNLLNPAVTTLVDGLTNTLTGSVTQWLLDIIGLGNLKNMSEDRIFDFIMDNLINPALQTLINGGSNVITGEIGNWLAGLIFPGQQGGLTFEHVSRINAAAVQNKEIIVRKYLQLLSQLQQNALDAKGIDFGNILSSLGIDLSTLLAGILGGIGKRNVDDKILGDLWNEISSGVSTVPQLIQEIITEHINVADIIQMIKDHFLEIVSSSSILTTVTGVLSGLGIDITSILGGIGKRDAKINISDIWNQIVTGSAGISTILQEIIDEHIDVPAILNMLASHLFEIIGNSSILTTVTGILSGLGLNIGDLLG